MSIWDDIKSWFDKEEKNDGRNALKQQEMMDYLDKMHKDYTKAKEDGYNEGLENYLPKEPEYDDYLKQSNRSDEEIKLIAEGSQKENIANEKEKIKNDYNKNTDEKESNAAEAKEKLDNDIKKVEESTIVATEREKIKQ